MIIGASRGIGLEFARQYAQAGWEVHATHRADGRALENIGGVCTHELEVTSKTDIQSLKQTLAGTPLDLIVLNAGIYGQQDASFGRTDVSAWLSTMHVNAIAPLQIAEALVENVANSEKKMIAAMSSKMGSMADNGSGGSYVYRSSKAALNAIVKSMSVDLFADYGIKVLALHPGWVMTDMTGANALITPQESVQGLRSVLAHAGPQDNGKFLDYKGTEIPW